ncbi:MAG: glycosyltransferase [Pirellulales bacterium]
MTSLINVFDPESKAASDAVASTIVVIPSYNGRHLLERLVPTLDVPPQQVVVVDQGNGDGTEDFCRSRGMHCLQLGSPASFTSASNAGTRWALDRGAQYVCLLNNDVELSTPVVHQLSELCAREPSIGAAAPTQIAVVADREILIYRVGWDCGTARFEHDLTPPLGRPETLEADYCEFTCVVVPARVFREVGLLDDRFGFYYEDADFGFRLGQRGYRAVYLQAAQIRHYMSATIGQWPRKKKHFVEQNRQYFQQKHVRPRVSYTAPNAPAPSSWSVCNVQLARHIHRLGLHADGAPLMRLGHPGIDCDYLFTVWETTRLPEEFCQAARRYQHLFVPSHWGEEVLRGHDIPNVSMVPLGVDTDVNSPWGEAFDYQAEKVFLTVAWHQTRKALPTTLAAWDATLAGRGDTLLVVYGWHNPWRKLGTPSSCTVYGKLRRIWFRERGLLFLEPVEPLTAAELAELYRGADVLVSNSHSEGFGLTIVEAMACGTLTIVPAYSATAEFIAGENCLPISGVPVSADYSDKGFHDVGQWWNPSLEDLKSQLLAAYHMTPEECQPMLHAARQHVLRHYTWRRAAFEMKASLDAIQGETVWQTRRTSRLFPVWNSAVRRAEQAAGRTIVKIAAKAKRFGEVLASRGAFDAGVAAATFTLRKARTSIVPPKPAPPAIAPPIEAEVRDSKDAA